MDKSELMEEVYEDAVQAHVCPSCKGMWLAKGALETVEETVEHDYSEELSRLPDIVGRAFEEARQKARGEMACPGCGAEMESREYAYCSQIMINRCPRCGGVWLDRGETEALEIFYERSRKETGRLRMSFLKGLFR